MQYSEKSIKNLFYEGGTQKQCHKSQHENF